MQHLTWIRTTFPRAFWGIRLTELKPFAFPLTPQQPLPSVFLSPESRVISKCFFLFGKDRTFLLHPLKAKTCCFLAPAALKHRGTEGFQSNSFSWQHCFRCGLGTFHPEAVVPVPAHSTLCLLLGPCTELQSPVRGGEQVGDDFWRGLPTLSVWKRLGNKDAKIQAVPASTFHQLGKNSIPEGHLCQRI